MRRPTVCTLLAVTLPALLLVAYGGTDDPGGAGDGTDDAVLDPDVGPGEDTEPGVVTDETTENDPATDDPATDEDAAGEATEQAGDADDDGAAGSGLEGAGALEPRVQEAIADLLDGGVDRDAITLVAAEPVVWPDGSIGCPEPGMMYTQALVEGYRIVLGVDGEEVVYHGAGNEPPFRCDAPAEPASGGNPTS
jgi:hypothetical protein